MTRNKDIIIEIEEIINNSKLSEKRTKKIASAISTQEQLIDDDLLQDISMFIKNNRQLHSYELFSTHIENGKKTKKWANVSDFMEMAEIDFVTIHNWKKNIHIPRKEKMLRIAIALNIGFESAEELLNASSTPFDMNNERDIIVSYFINKGESDIYVVQEYLEFWNQNILPATK